MAAPPNTNMRQQFPSMMSVSSMQSMLSMGHLPPGHGYVPKKQKPDKPYGLTFITRMNRTARGPGRKYLNYALACLIASFLFFLGAAVYFGHRNVSRMIVYRSEAAGALLVMMAICLLSLMGHYLIKARVASNAWRANIRFRPEGLFTAAAFNDEYVPETCMKQDLRTGTYGPKALKEIPKPKALRKKKKRRAQSKESLLSDDSLDSGGGGGYGGPGLPPRPNHDQRLYERRGQRRPGDMGASMERIMEEPPEYNGASINADMPPPPPDGYPPYPGAQQGYYDDNPQQPGQYPQQPVYYDSVPAQQQQQQPYYYSDQPEFGYYDNAPSPVSPFVADPEGYYMRTQPQAPSGGQPVVHQPRPGLEESEL